MRVRTPFQILATLVVVAVIILNAWVDEDAFISFRTISNFVAGYGLRFNIDERVQAFTHPLWLFVSTAFHLITKEFLLSSIITSVVCSLFAVFVLLRGAGRSVPQLVALTVILIFSRAFIHFSTSGLENSLSHLLSVLFVVTWLQESMAPGRKVLVLSLLTSLAAVNRLDTVLISGPAVAWFLLRNFSMANLRQAAIGVTPLAAWLLFSLFYYGYLFPNTYYAKLYTGIPAGELYAAGLFYLEHSLVRDPSTLVCIALACVVALVTRSAQLIALSVGLVLYLLYIISIGGDYMCGRFLSTPFIVAVFIIGVGVSRRAVLPALATVCVVLSFIAGGAPILTNFSTGKAYFAKSPPPFDTLVVDKQLYFYQSQGLPFLVQNPIYAATRELGKTTVRFVFALNLATMRSPYNEHIVDDVGLVDPILSRLPSRGYWRPGHFQRDIPLGYPGVLRGTMPHLCDAKLEQFREHVNTIVRGDLWSFDRLKTIGAMNTGAYKDLIDTRYYQDPVQTVQLSEVASVSDLNSCPGMMGSLGLKVTLPSASHASTVRLQAIEGERYKLRFMLGGAEKGIVEFGQRQCSSDCDELVSLEVSVPQAVKDAGFDMIWIAPLGRGWWGVQKVSAVSLEG